MTAGSDESTTVDRPAARAKPRIAVISLGGTIGTLVDDRLALATYADIGSAVDAADLLARIPEIHDDFDLSPARFEQMYSGHLTVGHWTALAGLVARLAGHADGIVITHGTGALEETAFFLHLTADLGTPIVLAGAMRPQGSLSGDGDLNLVNAIRVAAHPASRGLGVLVVMNDTIFTARDVTKANTHRTDAFVSRCGGPLGYVTPDGSVDYVRSPAPVRMGGFELKGAEQLPRVDIVTSYVGADRALIDAAVAAGARGLVSCGIGAGRPTPGERSALTDAVSRGVVVCQASRVGSGRVRRSESMRDAGVVAAKDLSPVAARILLMLALTKTDDSEVVQEMFDRC